MFEFRKLNRTPIAFWTKKHRISAEFGRMEIQSIWNKDLAKCEWNA
jgi:hypothetical protein